MTDLAIYNVYEHSQPNMALDDELKVKVQPFVNRLEKLSMINNSTFRGTSSQFRQFFEVFGLNLPWLRSLTLKKFIIDENGLELLSNEISNIAELHLNDMKMFKDVERFQLFLSRLKNLQVFAYMHCDVDIHIEAIADCLCKCFPNLRGFGCSVQQVLRKTNRETGDRYKFLEKFKHLSEFYVSAPVCMEVWCDIQNAFKFVPNLKRLSLYQIPNMPQLPVAIRRIAKPIKKLIDNRRNDRVSRSHHRVHVIVNNRQCREFRAIKNIADFISLEDVSTSNDLLNEYYEFSSSQNNFRRGNFFEARMFFLR